MNISIVVRIASTASLSIAFIVTSFDRQRKLATIEKSVEALQIQVEQRKCDLDTSRAALREAEAREENLRSELGYWKGMGIERFTTALQ